MPECTVASRSASSGSIARRWNAKDRTIAIRRGRDFGAGRVRRAGHRGQSRRRPLCTRTRHPLFRHLLGHAVRRGRVRSQHRRIGAGQLHRVRQGHAEPGHLPAGRAEDDTDKGGTMRLGAQSTRLVADSKAAACYGATDISERHRLAMSSTTFTVSSSPPAHVRGGHESGRGSGGNGESQPSVVSSGTVSSRIQVAADPAAPFVAGFVGAARSVTWPWTESRGKGIVKSGEWRGPFSQ